jgi:hypothetical protein
MRHRSPLKDRKFMQSERWICGLAATSLALACSQSWPEPKQPLADAEAASRSANEVGAQAQPAAKLEAQLADEQIAAAKARIAKGDNERATYLVLRARADAELALALAREQKALDAKQKAQEQARSTEEANTTKATP